MSIISMKKKKQKKKRNVIKEDKNKFNIVENKNVLRVFQPNKTKWLSFKWSNRT